MLRPLHIGTGGLKTEGCPVNSVLFLSGTVAEEDVEVQEFKLV
jgi:hypothetical protein